MSETFTNLKKVGLPATVAAVIAASITITPFLFKIDERYAKAAEFEAALEKNEETIAALTAEVGKLAGVTEVLITVIGQQQTVIATVRDAPLARRAVMAPPPPPMAEPYVDETVEAAIEEIAAIEEVTPPEVYAIVAEAAPAEVYAESEMAEVAADSVASPEIEVESALSEAASSLQESQRVIQEIQDQ